MTITTAICNGHPSYDHWNVYLWLHNDQKIYRAANSIIHDHNDLDDATEAVYTLMRNTMGAATPEGVPITRQLVRHAIEDDHEEAWQND